MVLLSHVVQISTLKQHASVAHAQLSKAESNVHAENNIDNISMTCITPKASATLQCAMCRASVNSYNNNCGS